MIRATKNWFKSLARLIFEAAQRLGVDILPHHFYSQIPDVAELKNETYWRAPSSMFGISGVDIESQLAFAQRCVPQALTTQLEALNIHQQAVAENGEDSGYGPIEADFLYGFIQNHQPAKIVQIGCGVTTAVVLRAAEDVGYQPEVICIEPFPMPFLEKADADGRIRLVKEKAQKTDLDLLIDLNPGDLLFVDSTHTVKPGSEVNRIILEVLPRLASGVFVHFHDIYFPYDYKRDVLAGDLFFWAENTLLHAFLINNPRYSIRACLSMIHYAGPEKLQQLIPRYQPQSNDDGLKLNSQGHFPSAIYLQVTGTD